MLIYKNTFENIQTIGFNFPIEDQFYASEKEAIVADGITRDPIGIRDFSTCSSKEFLEKYPRPRRDYRNNLNNIKDNKCISYGAITGEDSAIKFIKTGQVELSEGDVIAVYSDGFTNFLHDEYFILKILNFKKEDFENYIENKSKTNYEKYGKEKTIILYRN